MNLCYSSLGKNMIYSKFLAQKCCSFLLSPETSLFLQNAALFPFFSLTFGVFDVFLEKTTF